MFSSFRQYSKISDVPLVDFVRRIFGRLWHPIQTFFRQPLTMRFPVFSKRGVKSDKLSRRRAIRSHCHMCSDFEWARVVNCNFTDCVLYPYRLGQSEVKGLTPEDRRAAIHAFCCECSGGNPVDCDAVGCALFPYRNG